MKKLCFILILTITICSLNSCKKVNKVEKIGDFAYIHMYDKNPFIENKEDYYSVIGLTKEGREKKILTIPAEINGKKVMLIGADSIYDKAYNMDSDNLEVLYLSNQLFFPQKDVFKNCHNLQKVVCLSDENWDLTSYNYYDYVYNQYRIIDNEKKYFNIIFYANKEIIKNWGRSCLYRPANVVYFLNENEDIYYLDFIEDITNENLPKSPEKEEYKFLGWYKEKECINKWDINVDKLPIISIWGGSIRYEVTKLYPKWERV